MPVDLSLCPNCDRIRGEMRVIQAEKTSLQQQLALRAKENEDHKKARLAEFRYLELERDDYRRMVEHYRHVIEVEPVPPVLQQTPWPGGYLKFPGESNEVRYFNPSVIKFNGKLLLASRRWTRIGDGSINQILIWDLSRDMAVSNPRLVRFDNAPQEENHEDPRLFQYGDSLWLGCNNFIHGSRSHQVFGPLDADMHCQRIHLSAGGNGRSINDNVGHEKNWTFFGHDKGLMLVYTMAPQVIYRIGTKGTQEKYVSSGTNPLWRYGPPRGGTCPVRIGDEYFAFFHSSLPWRLRKRQYFMGFYSFSAVPPFGITRMSGAPLLAGSPKDPMNSDSPLVVFPCGAWYENGEWLVTMGINDNSTAWLKIPHEELLDITPPLRYRD